MTNAETKVQALQDALVEDIFEHVWNGYIPTPWVRHRDLTLTYSPSSPVM